MAMHNTIVMGKDHRITNLCPYLENVLPVQLIGELILECATTHIFLYKEKKLFIT